MIILIICLVVLAIIASIAGSIRYNKLKKKVKSGELKEMPEVKMVTDCGAETCSVEEGGLCELDCLLNSTKKDIDYYDDEELDQYKGIASDQFTEAQEEEFRSIFETMQPTDVPGWVRSLQQRGLNLPDNLKDEVFIILDEQIRTGAYKTA